MYLSVQFLKRKKLRMLINAFVVIRSRCNKLLLSCLRFWKNTLLLKQIFSKYQSCRLAGDSNTYLYYTTYHVSKLVFSTKTGHYVKQWHQAVFITTDNLSSDVNYIHKKNHLINLSIFTISYYVPIYVVFQQYKILFGR